MIEILRRYLLRSAWFYLYLVIEIVVACCSLAAPLLSGILLNALAAGRMNIMGLICLCLLVALCGLGRAMLSYCSEMLYTCLQTRLGFELNADTIAHVQCLPNKFFASFDAGYYSQQINHDANDLLSFIITSVSRGAGSVVSLAIVLIVLFQMNWVLGCVCVVCGMLSGALYQVFKSRLYTNGYAMQEQLASFFSCLLSQLDNILFLRRHSLFGVFAERLHASFEETYAAVRSSQQSTSGFSLCNSAVMTISRFAVLVAGVVEAASGRLEIGYLVTSLSYFSVFSDSIQYFIKWSGDYQKSRVCLDRLSKIWLVEEEHDGHRVVSGISFIECHNVSFSFQNTQTPVISGFSGLFETGKMVGIAGKNGSGKTTLLELLLGLHADGYDGEISYDGVSIREIDKRKARAFHIGIAEQEPPIISGTLRENLTLLADKYDQGALERYVDAIGLKGLVQKSPLGMDTILDAAQNNLSGGEKQKIAIIRLLLKNPDVMFFDEPTSALDSSSKSGLMKILKAEKGAHVIIVVSHDREVLSACDDVLWLDED